MALETKLWDGAEYLTDDTEIAEYLAIVLEDGELPTIYASSIALTARARGGFDVLALESHIPEHELRNAASGSESDSLPTLRKLQRAYAHRSSELRVA